jgi:hypothetical protein
MRLLFLAAVSQTLAAFVKILSENNSLEKNLFCRRFIKSIIYSRESIQINLFSPLAEKEKSPNFVGGNSGLNIKNGWAFRLNPNHIIPIILPNAIHQCRKKNLSR